MQVKDIFILHHSVFNDAFRTDYTTPFRDSSKKFFEILLRHKIMYKKKVAYTSGEVFSKLLNSPIGKTKIIWVIPEQLVEIDFSTYLKEDTCLKLEQSIITLASKKCIETTPYIVATKPKDKIELEGTNFIIITPKVAIDYLEHPNSRFVDHEKCK